MTPSPVAVGHLDVGLNMKTKEKMQICAECSTEYEAFYDGCPACGPDADSTPVSQYSPRLMRVLRIVLVLAIMNSGIFLISAAYLPKKGSYGFSGPVSRFINSRDRWDIPWVVLLGSSLISAGGTFLLYDGRKRAPTSRVS